MKPVSKTAFYCCGLRMEDARRDRPLCGDEYAEVFMSEEGLEYFHRFDGEDAPNSSNLVRHRLIDDVVRETIAADPRRRIFTLGAGFDTRPYRLDGGRWTELDAPELIAYKNERLPASDAKNELTRIAIDLEAQSTGDALVGFATNDPVAFVVEGVLMYLTTAQILDLLDTVTGLFPNHRIVCDLMTKSMFDKYAVSMHEKLVEAHTTMTVTEHDPADLFLRSGYRLVRRMSIPEAMCHHRMPGSMPVLVLKTMFRALYKGYTIAVFDTGAYA